MNSAISPRCASAFTVAHFLDIGARYGIDYHFPALEQGRQDVAQRAVVQGYVEEWVLPAGVCITRSDLQVIEPYESTSTGHSPLYVLLVLSGQVEIAVNGCYQHLHSGMALTTRLDAQQTLSARHQAAERLVTLSLAIDPQRFCPSSAVAAYLAQWQQTQPQTALRAIPGVVLQSLQQLPAGDSLAHQLILEGILLQLLGYWMIPTPSVSPVSPLCPRELQRLEQVKQLIESAPERPYTLDALAQLAAMSASSLRSKFRQCYGESIFNYLRQCRLALAREYLQQGYSVQQAAWMSGYQHATNFATAFRRQYGVAPSELA
ncbi:helix-turn-helix domain-containing protein [Pantoea sp. A4]|uniref:helix-turn-helix domain-containing protein n=1 Tax=Pantoea sp. A4 TaxID=1225184 RepID=UPI000382EA2C|nr:AraC family transcriptional regulator [Pantoea sp. A4]